MARGNFGGQSSLKDGLICPFGPVYRTSSEAIGSAVRLTKNFRSHLEEAIEHGLDPADARRAFGSLVRHREESRDFRLVVWLDSLRADLIFGWRQLTKRRATSAAAVLSLALAIGSCTSAFRLVDACCFAQCRSRMRTACTLWHCAEQVPMAHSESVTAMNIRNSF